MLTAFAVLIFVAVIHEYGGGKETSLYKQEFGKQPPNCFAYALGCECCFPLILHTIPFRAMAALMLPKLSCTSYWG